MRIAYIFQDQYPWDIRADKVTASFAEAGHHTIIVSRNRSGLPVWEELKSNLFVQRLPGPRSTLLRQLINFPAFFSPFWLWTLFRAVSREKLGLIIVRDLPMSPAAWLVGLITGVPVIIDMAEDYPAMIQDTWDYRGPARFDFLLRNPKILRVLERWIVKKVDGILVVSPASRQRVLSLLGNKLTPVHVIQNTPRLSAWNEPAESDLSRLMNSISQPKILYVGGLEEMRGLATVVEAMPELIRRIGAVQLIIVGEGTSRAGLERRVAELAIGDYVKFPGWLDQSYVPGVIAAADVGIVPHLVTGHTSTTLPNKIYDYMAQGKAVVVTQADSLREMVDTYTCGLWYEDKKPSMLTQTLETLLGNAEMRAQMGASGKRAVKEQLNWSVDAQSLLVFAAAIANGK